EQIASLCERWGAYAVSDEIYQYLVYDGAQHVSIAALPGMRERAITINSMSKTYSVTGWRVGYVTAAPEVSDAIRKMHDFITVGAPAPLQQAGVTALNLPDDYYARSRKEYEARRDRFLPVLEKAGFRCFKPRGAYYIMTDISGFGFQDDVQFARHLVEKVGVAVVPGSSFYSHPGLGRRQVRFCYSKTDATLNAAAERLMRLR
ncbi:MAG: aminotransferase class I/II-fold pyridoxal phosphate-dependent enzyme, partial [Acidobacteriota bacterium]|nr:aminotransferase class I/II-fold pyridoxal phosphate-dependent enzyme [Acidobacteriota bacterium]